MKKGKTHLIPQLFLTLGLGACLSFGSCSDNDIAGGGNNNNNGNDTTLVDQIDKHDALTRLLGALADVDSLPEVWSTYTVEPTVGIVKDAAEPHVRYLIVPNAAEAYRTYCSYIGASTTGEAKNDEWKVDSIGSLRFEVNNQADLYATLKVNVQQLPTLEELRFVPSSAIGDNGIKPAGVYYRFGDVIKQTKEGIETYYVCVRPCSMASELRKTHWATLQTCGKNFKELSDNLKLPTKLCSKQDEGVRMAQNFFNVLRIAEDPSIYNPQAGTGILIDKIPQTEFNIYQAQALHNLWELDDTWGKVQYTPGFESELRPMLKDLNTLTAFYYGYSSVWWPGKGDYRVYQLDLSSSKDGFNMFDVATASTPWVNKRTNSDDHKTLFSSLQTQPSNKDVYIDSYGKCLSGKNFVVKTQTGAELLGKSGVDPNPDKSFVGQKVSGDIQIEEIFTQNKARTTPLFTIGDVVNGSKYYNKEQICILNNYNWPSTKSSYFLCKDNSEDAFTSGIPSEIEYKSLVEQILYPLYLAYRYAVKKEEYVPTMYSGAWDKESQDNLNKVFRLLYNDYLEGKIAVSDDGYSLTANLNGQCWKLTIYKNANEYDAKSKKFEIEKVENSGNLPVLRIVYYNEGEKPPYEDFSTNNKNITYNLKGFRRRLFYNLATNFETFDLFDYWYDNEIEIKYKK